MVSTREGECVFFYQGHMFLHSLELIPIHNNRALEVAQPNVKDLIPFVQSQFDSPCIDHLFAVLHWKHGDKLHMAMKLVPGTTSTRSYGKI